MKDGYRPEAPVEPVEVQSDKKRRQGLRRSSEGSGEDYRIPGFLSDCSGEDAHGMGVGFPILFSMLFDDQAEGSTVRDRLRETDVPIVKAECYLDRPLHLQ